MQRGASRTATRAEEPILQASGKGTDVAEAVVAYTGGSRSLSNRVHWSLGLWASVPVLEDYSPVTVANRHRVLAILGSCELVSVRSEGRTAASCEPVSHIAIGTPAVDSDETVSIRQAGCPSLLRLASLRKKAGPSRKAGWEQFVGEEEESVSSHAYRGLLEVVTRRQCQQCSEYSHSAGERSHTGRERYGGAAPPCTSMPLTQPNLSRASLSPPILSDRAQQRKPPSSKLQHLGRVSSPQA